MKDTDRLDARKLKKIKKEQDDIETAIRNAELDKELYDDLPFNFALDMA